MATSCAMPLLRRGLHLGAAVSVLALSVGLGPVDAALAQAAPGPEDEGIGDIVVTAQRREESLQDVPIAVTALGENALRNLQADNLGDLEGSVPNLSIHVGDAQNAVVYIRGVGQIDSLAFADPGVGIYVDDVYLGRAQGAFLDIYDVERVEVLRGPQGTLYGRNTIGGAVKFVSKPLTNELSGQAEATVGSYDRFDLKGTLNVPLVEDRLLAKVAVARSSRKGFAENVATGQDDGDKDLWAARLALEFRPSDMVRFRFNADISRDNPDFSRTPARATPVLGLAQPNEDPFKVDADFNDRNYLRTGGLSLVASWEVTPSTELKSISAYRELDYKTNLDLDATALPLFGVYVDETQNQFSQELQLVHSGERLSAVAGLFYFREHDVTLSGLYGPAIELVTGSVNDQHTDSYAAFGQLTYELTDKLSATVGLRYTHEEKDFARTQKFFPATTPFPFDYDSGGLLVTDIDTSGDWGSLSPKFGLDYRWSDDVMTYVSVSRGFKSGGFDGRSNDARGAQPYDPETMWSYELGLKSSLLDRRLTANFAVFQNDYKDLQLSSFVADASGNFAALFTNAGKARIRGAEVELAARPFAGLSLNGTVGYLDGEYLEYIGPGGVDISDQRELVNAPRWTVRVGGTYDIALGSAGTLVLGADASHRSKVYTVVSSSEVLAQDATTLIDAFVRFEPVSERWWLSAGVKNLTDKRYISHGFDLSDSLGYQLAYYGDPRTYNFTFGVRF